MWLLMTALLNQVPGFTQTTVLNVYATSEQYQSVRNHVGFEMAAAYPHERDFVMTCQFNPKHGT